MGRRGATRVTAQDIARAGGIQGFVKLLVKKMQSGDSGEQEVASTSMKNLAEQSHGEHADLLFSSGAVSPLVKLLNSGTAVAQAACASALHYIGQRKAAHQTAIVEAGAIKPLVKLLKSGGSKVQEAVRMLFTKMFCNCNLASLSP